MSVTRIFRDDAPLAFVDIETTGGQAAWHRITEIAIVAAHGDTVDFEWQTLVNPGRPIPPSITALTGIDNDLVRDAPSFAEIARELRERLGGRLFIAHNVRFDYGFIRGEFQRIGERWQAPTACTARLSRRLFPQQARHNLDTVIAVHGISCPVRHRAMPDAAALWQFWQKLRREQALQLLDETLALVSQVSVLPPHLPADLAEDLPEAPGVYRFFGASTQGADSLIYVGKANNLRERVLSHFAGAHRDTKSQRLREQTRRVEWSVTAGELGALLLEARQVREEKPVYNRKLRGGKLVSWQWPDDAIAPQLVEPDEALAAGAPVFGLFKGESAARKALRSLAEDQRLCLKSLGLESGDGSCFAYQLKRCRGACVGAEPPALHAVRARLAMLGWKLADWPFRGAVAAIERGAAGRVALHVLDRWMHLGSLECGADDAAIDEDGLRQRCRPLLATAASRGGGFDADTYRILARHFREHPRKGGYVPLDSGTMPE